jgi:hypothetical protein
MTDLLRQLIMDIRKQQRQKRALHPISLKGSSPHIPSSRRQTISGIWEAGRLISLHHKETNQCLGIFREFNRRKDNSRRLVPFVGRDGIVSEVEVVSGSHWLAPLIKPVQNTNQGYANVIRR